MRKTLLSLVALFICAASNAQVAHWMLPPDYDAITVNNAGLLEVRLGTKVGLYDRTGKELIPIAYDSISEFNEGYAILYNGDRFVGFTDEQGKIIDLSTRSYTLTKGADFFSCGRLLVSANSHYSYLNNEGKEVCGVHDMAYPFFEGYAVVVSAIDGRDPSKMQYSMIDVDGNPYIFDKDYSLADIQFISSFRDGKAVLVSKNKFHTFYVKYPRPEPIYTDDSESKKSIATLEFSNTLGLVTYPDNRSHIKCKRDAEFIFNSNLQLDEYMFENQPTVVLPAKEKECRVAPESVLTVISDGSKFGLSYNEHELLPPQFEAITITEDDFAVVQHNSKYGIIILDPASNFEFDIDNNKNITFRHESKDVKLKAALPTYIKQAQVESISSDCILDNSSLNTIANLTGQFVIYNCTLKIPSDLTEELTDHAYQFVLIYDNLRSTVNEVHVNEWYQKYYDVEITNTSFPLDKVDEEIKIDFDVKKNEVTLDTDTYFKTIEVFQVMDDKSLTKLTTNPINDFHYTFTLPLKEVKEQAKKELNFEIHITEIGCPTIVRPFKVNFELPEPTKDGEPADNTPVKVTVQAEQRKAPAATNKPKQQKKAEQPTHDLSSKGKNTVFEVITDVESSTNSKK